MFFDESTPERKKRALKQDGNKARQLLERSPIPEAKEYKLLTYYAIMSGGDRTFAFDVESYPNYFEVGFKCIDSNEVIYFEDSPNGYSINGFEVDANTWLLNLAFIMVRFKVVGFNSRSYDLPMIHCALSGVRAHMLNKISNEIIFGDMQAYEIERKYCRNVAKVNHIDIIEVAPLGASLKLYAGRLHCERMQDLPFPVNTELQPWQIQVVRDYNINDLDNTILMWEHLLPQITLREQLGDTYNSDLRSRSDAQIAETVIASELEKIGVKGKAPSLPSDYEFYYQMPPVITFITPQFQTVADIVIKAPWRLGASGHPECPQEIEALRPRLGNCVYRLGAGGLHSSEKSVYYKADENTLLIDRDVASYYPYIIINQKLAPLHLGEPFLKVFESIVNKRINAKREGRKLEADSLKITINGTFGKLGNRYSLFYSPDMLIQVTMSGQLYLLMLIEAIELAGIPVVSANTDGIVINCPVDRYKDLEAVIIIWEEKTGFLTEETRYKALYSRDVNNYIAIKEEGGCKLKGEYSEVGSALNSPLSKNPEAYICSWAVQQFLEHGIDIADTVESCKDLTKFLSVRQVKGGAEKDGVFLGKAVRWYYAKDEKGTINYVSTGNKVPKSEGAKPCMILPKEFPNDIDYDWYINTATDMLYDLGVLRKITTERLL